MWSALEDVADILEQMAEGTCLPRYYLASLDPGVGKTKTMIHFIRTLLASEDHERVSVLICVSRLDEIRNLVEEMGLSRSQFSVLTSDTDLNGLGSDDRDQARILFTTQQMIESRCQGEQFKHVSAFHYQGQARDVRIWDEAILPGQPLTLKRDDLGHLFGPIRLRHPALAKDIEDLFIQIKEASCGSRVEIPDYSEKHGVDLNTVIGCLSESPKQHIDAVTTLWLLSGKLVTVKQDGASGNTLLDYRDTLPDDFAPLLILDASGRVRATYDQWERKRGNLIRLSKAEKSYRNLTVNVWQTGGGKHAFRTNGEQLIDGIVSTINNKPKEEWLVVHHKTKGGIDVPSGVKALMDGNPGRVHFTHWGDHHGTNAYAHVSNVILAGTLFLPASQYEALGRLGAGLSSAQSLDPQDFQQIRIGEYRHLILQALCRGSVRRCDGAVCAPCDAYIIASAQSGIAETLPEIFPDCRVKRWQPVKKVLKGKIAEALKVIQDYFSSHPRELLPFREVADAVQMTDLKNFRRSIRKHPDFVEALAEAGVMEFGPGRNPTGFRMAVSVFGFDGIDDGDF
ncbi:type III restriction/modification enzyme restriction subunit [Aestuariispira insulae]|uniref:Type III restriction/modification enzyme restriction subunit n=1 Tax=Aestuariispira insulae TaxID=1461337 RepID=A0A3D9H779_9PROT|nr:DEAD/DEAH box helicase family protein [Aestuariispira insulae]RED45011.1 type III restriction/modification enzyme restriction subunit [Aestuariispira insulae]